jgi:hypothetical protein
MRRTARPPDTLGAALDTSPMPPRPSADHDLVARWPPIEARLREVEETYRTERIRKGGRPHPEGARLEQLERDLSDTLEIYMHTTAEHRAILRELFAWSYELPRHLDRIARVDPAACDPDSAVASLRRALAAASLADDKAEYRDLYLSLGDAWISLRRRGIDPRPMFQEAAAWSSEAKSSDRFCVRRFLGEFDRSLYFQTSVAPRLAIP